MMEEARMRIHWVFPRDPVLRALRYILQLKIPHRHS